MKQNAINFKQERDFSELFNATFGFIGQEFRQLGTAILYFVVPFMILTAIAGTFFSIRIQEITHYMDINSTNPFAIFSDLGSVFGYIGIVALLSLISTTMMFGTVYGYIKLYVENDSHDFSLNDVWMQVTRNFLKMFFGVLITGLVLFVGFAFLLIPGIYLWVALSIVFCVMIFEGLDYGNSFGRSIKLINKKWWFAFALLLVMGIILFVMRLFMTLPAAIAGLKSVFANIGYIRAGENILPHLPLSFFIVNSLTKLAVHLLSVIPIVLTAFLYFSRVEEVEKPVLTKKTEQIGED